MGWRARLDDRLDPVEARWVFPKDWDFNGDFQFTISDCSQALGWIFHAPGDGVIYALLNRSPDTAQFLELSHRAYGAFISGALSGVAWAMVYGIAYSIWDVFKEKGT